MENIYFSTIKMLLVVVAMVCGIILFFRYSGKLRLKLPTKSSGLQKVDTIHLGYRKFVSVMEIKDRVLVVGVGEKEISLLASWRKEEEQT
jgi:flagellar biogenesis protein FliO